MEEIVNEEISNSERLIPICRADNRIGYHSEAHGHKIFPEKLEWRIEKLRELLKTEFPEVKARIECGKAPLEFYTGAESRVVYRVGIDGDMPLVDKNGGEGETSVRVDTCDGGYKISVLARGIGDDFLVIKPEFRVFHPSSPILMSKNEFIFPSSKRFFFTFANSYRSFSIHPDDVDAELKKYNFSLEQISDEDYLFQFYIDRERFGMEQSEPFRLDVERFATGKRYDLGCAEAKEAFCFSDKCVSRLVHGTIYPECYAFIIP
jgi:hypothetical protein